MKKLLRKIKRLGDRILGTKSDELFWQFRHFFDKAWAESYISKISLDHPHRAMVIEAVSHYEPFSSVLEVGSASGPNLYLLAKKFPHAKYYGIDISAPAVAQGMKFFKKEHMDNIFLRQGTADSLQSYGDRSMDIVFSDAALLYVGLDKIEVAAQEMIRVAKKAVILCEQHTEETSFYDDHWVHNYISVFSKFVFEERIKIAKISPEIWGGDWGRYGAIIEVSLGDKT